MGLVITKPVVFLVIGLTVASILSLPWQLKELCFQSTYLPVETRKKTK